MTGAVLVDSHCHLTLLSEGGSPEGLERVILSAEATGVRYILGVAIDLKSFRDISDISLKYRNVYSSVGIHPNSEPETEPGLEALLELAALPQVVAVGETGLDYYRSRGDLRPQQERFCRHIRCAREVGKPLIVHSREAAADTLRLLEEEKGYEVGGVIHCFTYDYETARRAIDNNFLVSFSGILTFRSARELQEVARRLPFESILVETDAPYLAPVPYRGQENHPAYVREVAAFLARLREVSLEEVARRTTENFFRTFRHARPHECA